MLQALIEDLDDIFDKPGVDTDTFMVLGMAGFYIYEDALALQAFQVVQHRAPEAADAYFFAGLIYAEQNNMQMAEVNPYSAK